MGMNNSTSFCGRSENDEQVCWYENGFYTTDGRHGTKASATTAILYMTSNNRVASIWEKLGVNREELVIRKTPVVGMADVFGKLPGDESDQEIIDTLQEIE